MKKVFGFSLLLALILFCFSPPCVTPAVAIDTGPLITATIPIATIATPAAAVLESISTAYAFQNTPEGDVVGSDDGFMDLLKANWIELLIALLAFWEIIARLTKTKVDNSIISWAMKIINLLFPNRKSGGG